mmetsp:Transcript_27821/g.75687  ORF Transcript_27821/g.75687 Transcript_27821/m.75687 type:complete len:343 (-) Transcript_27821:148-1176(-)|eukprot:CAMPEP_0172369416 /NCGR_PEP_ID=MMETSP1060-20121228/32754_1 /TAXON_ID=37318 /ORGANISM="Pseudo-nitzschia pungens, Strain cf. cingulata" /LENGTH=342 /DNA_ID=CAMNT_0013094339 /DNA_START=237 /DNA_END=1265 /DNA_ORIENTATION=-
MKSPLLGTKIFTRYHQHRTHRNYEESDKNSDGGGINETDVSPNRRTDFIPEKATSNARHMGIDCIQSDSNNDTQFGHILDDLTMGYSESPSPRRTTERNTVENALSPSSGRSFRVKSLDRCLEEVVSPLFPDSSSASASISSFPNVIMIPGPLISSIDAKEEFPLFVMAQGGYETRIPKGIKTPTELPTKEVTVSHGNPFETKTTPASKQRQRKSNHSRSHFVFDGNLSFGSVSPPPMYASPSPMYLSPTTRVSPPDISMASYPISPAVSASPPRSFDIGSWDEEICCDKKQQGRKTPPPSHKEQRRRNRAMPSMQYETIILNRLRQQKQQEQEQLRQQKSW